MFVTTEMIKDLENGKLVLHLMQISLVAYCDVCASYVTLMLMRKARDEVKLYYSSVIMVSKGQFYNFKHIAGVYTIYN